MNLDEAKRVIDRAWNRGPSAIDWNDVEEASAVIVAETGAIYIPPLAHDEIAEYARREHRPADPATRGVKGGYERGSRTMREATNPVSRGVHRSIRESIPREHSMRELVSVDEPPPGWARR